MNSNDNHHEEVVFILYVNNVFNKSQVAYNDVTLLPSVNCAEIIRMSNNSLKSKVIPVSKHSNYSSSRRSPKNNSNYHSSRDR